MTLLEAGVPYIGCSESLGTHKPIIDIYNNIRPRPRGYKVKYTDSWCMAFVSACAAMAGRPDRFPYECSCQEAIEKLKEEGLWDEDDAYAPEVNDLIFYHWGKCSGDCQKVPNHVGIVAGVKDGIIRVLEGNYSDRVQWREIGINHPYTRGFGLTSRLWGMTSPAAVARQVIAGKWGDNPERKERLEEAGYEYDVVQGLVNAFYNREVADDKCSLFEIADDVIRGEWGNNPERKKALIAAGYDYDAVMEIVNSHY